MKTVKDVNFAGKKVLVRCEFNVPVEDGKIGDTQRIEESAKTVKYILEQNPEAILLVAHLGRPEGKIIPELSLKQILAEVEKAVGQKVILVEGLEELSSLREKDFAGETKIFLLENVRFWPEEESANEEFGKKIAEGFDVYVNECFSTSHRSHASFVKIPLFIQEKCVGFTCAEEVEKLSQVKDNPNHPAVMVIGGAKIETKLPVIENLKNSYDFILVGGKVANEALDENVALGENVLLPVDFAPEGKEDQRLDVGPKTVAMFNEKIDQAQTIIWNGPMGKYEDDDAAQGTKDIMKAIAKNKEALQVIGGGETLDVIKAFGSFSDFDYVSMSGGAMLEFLAGKKLPGLEILEK